MSWLTRHVLSLGVLVFALAIVGTVFTFARPEYRPVSNTTTVDMARQHQYTVAQIERAFATHAIPLAVINRNGDAKHGAVFLARPRRGPLAPTFLVTRFGPEAKVMFGPASTTTYEERFGNVDVSYGMPHPNAALLARIKAAVADLRQ
jgi:membrane-bound lytic murein transglycosylase B